MLVVAFLNPAAQLDEVLVDVHHDPFDGLGSALIVPAMIERDPAAFVL